MTVIPSVWPEVIKPDVASPIAILRAQAGYLTEKTRGILRADVVTSLDDGQYSHRFVLVASALEMYRRVLLVARHREDPLYPVEVVSEFPRPQIRGPFGGLNVGEMMQRVTEGPPQANSDDEFLHIVRSILGCGDVKAIIVSLIARSNDIRVGQQDSEQQPPDQQPLAQEPNEGSEGEENL